MSAKQRGLGRGLGALIGDFPEEPESGAVTKLPLQKVEPNPDQPRRTFDGRSCRLWRIPLPPTASYSRWPSAQAVTAFIRSSRASAVGVRPGWRA